LLNVTASFVFPYQNIVCGLQTQIYWDFAFGGGGGEGGAGFFTTT
jgi:hypothetical protein